MPVNESYVTQLEAKVKAQEADIQRKDDLIRTLTSMEFPIETTRHDVERTSEESGYRREGLTDPRMRVGNVGAETSEVVSEHSKQRDRINELTEKIVQRDVQLAQRNRTLSRLGEQLQLSPGADQRMGQPHYNAEEGLALEARVHRLTEELVDAQLHIRQLENQLSHEPQLRDHSTRMHQALVNEEFQLFRDSLASILSSPYHLCDSTPAAIKDQTRRIVAECKEQKEICADLEARIAELSTRLSASKMRDDVTEHQRGQVERENRELREQVRQLELQLTNSQVVRDEQRADKERLFFYLCKLATKMKIDRTVASRMPMDELQEAICTRLEQIMSGEYPLLTDARANGDRVRGLTRTVHRLQDQLSSKEIQLGMWRAKTTKLEQQVLNLSQLESEMQAEKENMKRATAAKRRVELENGQLRDEVHHLRADLLDLTDSKYRCSKMEDDLAELNKSNDELEQIRTSQASKIAQLQEIIDKQHKQLLECRARSTEVIDVLKEDLSSYRRTVDQLRRSEGELFEFRSLVGRLLGLDIDTLTVPNYDIVNELQKFVATRKSPMSEESTIAVRRITYSPTNDEVLDASGTTAPVTGPKGGLVTVRSKEAKSSTVNYQPASKVNPRVALRSELGNDGRRKQRPPKPIKTDPRKY
ncbi:unnamed protein product [Dicrocoelium dendriticum]|nr:unnamed protein product [Dicrocoelium dendriticum]CAH8556684.1 unnamed protein product [Dicrocoelium dendriticum]